MVSHTCSGNEGALPLSLYHEIHVSILQPLLISRNDNTTPACLAGLFCTMDQHCAQVFLYILYLSHACAGVYGWGHGYLAGSPLTDAPCLL